MRFRVSGVDLLLYWGIIGTIGVAHSLLLTVGTLWHSVTQFYIITWVSSIAILLFCWVRYKEHEQFDYDEPLNSDKLLFVLFGIVGTLFISALLISRYTKSSIWVPQPQMSLTIGSLNMNALINDLFYQFGLVCNSEETMVLSLTQVLRKKLSTSNRIQKHLGDQGIRASSILIPRGGWGVLHAYVAYIGPLQPILVLSAVISGVIISYAAYNDYVKSFLAALLIHFGFNASVILAPYLLAVLGVV
jgi:hypothetical protein